MKGYLHYISSPQAFRDPGPLWGGYKKRTVFLSAFLCCRATLTHSRTPASYRACVIPRRAAQEGFYLSTLSSVLVSSCQTVYRCDLFAATISSGEERSHIHRRHHSCRRWIVFLNLFMYIYFLYFILSFQSYGMIHKVWSQCSILSSLNTYIPPKTEAELLSPFTTTDLMGTSSALLFAFIYLLIWITCILPPWKYSHTSCPERDYAYSLLMKPSVNIFSFFSLFFRELSPS